MKLELKHLAGYLPYGLKYKDIPDGFEGIRELGLFDIDWCLVNGKPILRPLSGLTRKELELEGFDSYIDYLTYENKGSEWTLKAPFNMVQYLLSQHFDIYGLIENGLAIDINTLQK